jgi:hypothetical protein
VDKLTHEIRHAVACPGFSIGSQLHSPSV